MRFYALFRLYDRIQKAHDQGHKETEYVLQEFLKRMEMMKWELR